ncbi:MAG: hypothetical protein IJH12_09530 [Clostridia bacterium]|nr:hypothetical protein [Clostridia bacterium]
MLKDKVDTIKQALVKVDNTKNKKSVENLVVLAIVLVVTVVAINYIWKDDKKKNNALISNTAVNQGDTKTMVQKIEEENLEDRLSEILSNISGVGEVKVLLTYSETNKINPVYNEDEQSSVTEETDTSGGKRTINSTNNKREVVYSNDNVVTQSISSPQIQGAVVIAKGAENVKTKTDIIQAVSAATGLSTYKIQVFEMK